MVFLRSPRSLCIRIPPLNFFSLRSASYLRKMEIKYSRASRVDWANKYCGHVFISSCLDISRDHRNVTHEVGIPLSQVWKGSNKPRIVNTRGKSLPQSGGNARDALAGWNAGVLVTKRNRIWRQLPPEWISNHTSMTLACQGPQPTVTLRFHSVSRRSRVHQLGDAVNFIGSTHSIGDMFCDDMNEYTKLEICSCQKDSYKDYSRLPCDAV
jgi:hypothetical protein